MSQLPATAAARLAIDCSSGLSMVLKNADKSYAFTTSATRSSDLLPTELNNLFTQSGVSVTEISEIFVTTGPGSFTGIRLGLATAEALKLLNPAITIIGLSSLHATALQVVAEHTPQTPFTVALDAAGGQTYTQTFSAAGKPLTEALCLPVAQLPTEYPVFAQATLLIAGTQLATLNADYLFQLAGDAATHLPSYPVYLKPLTYKQV